MSKDKTRKELASLPFSEKIKILEELRARSLAIAAAGLRRSSSASGKLKAQHPPEERGKR